MAPQDVKRQRYEISNDSDRIDWVDTVQQALDGMSGNHALLLPVHDHTGELADFWIAAVAPGTVDAFGRRGREIIGARLRGDYGQAIQGAIWEAFREVLAEGGARSVGPFPYDRNGTDLPPAQFTVWLRRVGTGLLDSWTREDDLGRLEERAAQTERLANLGWSDQDMVTGTIGWSEQLYRIYERDPADGPMSASELTAATVPEDRPIRHRAAQRLARGEPTDVTYRLRLPKAGMKYVRAIADTVRDVHGRPLRIYGIVQDITAQVTSRSNLAKTERRLFEHQQLLAAEHRLVAELQQIILPIPTAPFDLPGLRVAVRYLPAEQANRIGGDWYHAGPALDGSVILAVGDVAGHGLRAAATMAKLRQAFVTLVATATTDPAELLTYLNRLMIVEGGESVSLASAVVARYDPIANTVVWAQAGHPAPLRTRAGVTAELDRPPGPMLGVAEAAEYATTGVSITPGDLLVFFTDGLIERRGYPIDEGLKPVMATLNRLSSEGNPRPLAELLGQLHRANPDDDTCILAVRTLTSETAVSADLRK